MPLATTTSWLGPALGLRHIEMSTHKIARCNGHAAVVVRAAIKHVSSSVVRDAHEWKVRRGLLVVPVSSPLRHAVETIAGDGYDPRA